MLVFAQEGVEGARKGGTGSAHSQPQQQKGTKHGGHYNDGNVTQLTQHCSLEDEAGKSGGS